MKEREKMNEMNMAFTAVFLELNDEYIAFIEELPAMNAHGRSVSEARKALYALAAEKLNLAAPGARPLSSGYWFPGDGGFKRGLKFHESTDDGLVESADWAALRGTLVEHVFGLVRDIRRGEFPMFNTNPQCTESCDFSTVCRVRQTRSLEKQWPSPNNAQP
jgi:hypothetical protein